MATDIKRFLGLPERLRKVSTSDRSDLFDLIDQMEDFSQMYEENRNIRGESDKPAPFGYLGRINSIITFLWYKYRPEIAPPCSPDFEMMADDVEFILGRIARHKSVRKTDEKAKRNNR